MSYRVDRSKNDFVIIHFIRVIIRIIIAKIIHPQVRGGCLASFCFRIYFYSIYFLFL